MTKLKANQTDDVTGEKWGCHCDLPPGQEPGDCVLDAGRLDDCSHAMLLAKGGLGREYCKHWRRYW